MQALLPSKFSMNPRDSRVLSSISLLTELRRWRLPQTGVWRQDLAHSRGSSNQRGWCGYAPHVKVSFGVLWGIGRLGIARRQRGSAVQERQPTYRIEHSTSQPAGQRD